MRAFEAIQYYSNAREELLRLGYEEDVNHFRELAIGALVPDSMFFLTECAWVIYAAGFSADVLDKKWPSIKKSFRSFDPSSILGDRERCIRDVLMAFPNQRKASFILDNAGLVKEIERQHGSIGSFLKKLQARKDGSLERELDRFRGIGPINVKQLIRNLGLESVEKEDVHLKELSMKFECSGVAELVGAISKETGDPAGVVDFILWLHNARPRPLPRLTLRKHA